MSADCETLYYQALTGEHLYRIPTSPLRDGREDASAAVEQVADTFPVDGLWMDSEDRIYLSGLTQNSVLRRSSNGRIETLVTDERLQWPDTFTQGPDGAIYISASHINHMPRFNQGRSTRTMPYAVFRIEP